MMRRGELTISTMTRLSDLAKQLKRAPNLNVKH